MVETYASQHFCSAKCGAEKKEKIGVYCSFKRTALSMLVGGVKFYHTCLNCPRLRIRATGVTGLNKAEPVSWRKSEEVFADKRIFSIKGCRDLRTENSKQTVMIVRI
ncbi:hypothetical protein GN956_G7898 [Arapaima gigas]